jgi:putative oxidoreductase
MTDGTRAPERIIPAFGKIYDPLTPYAYPLIRFVAGAMLIPHGWAKLVSGSPAGLAQSLAKMGIEPAYALAYYIGTLELVGGTMLALGLFTRFVAAQVIGFMAVAAFKVHWGAGFFWNKGGYEYPLFWGLVAVAILIRGGGRLSLDSRIGKEL